MANTQEMIENLFKSIDLITDKKLEGLEYDKTITCSIIDNKYASRGEYTVSDGVTVFKALTDVTTYQVGQYVYVKIINGSFNNQKIIVGKYVDDTTEYYTYVSPMNSYLDITHNLIEEKDNSETTMSILANGSTKEKLVWRVYNRGYKKYDKLGIRAGFKTWLNQYKLDQGNYGLRLYLVSENISGTQGGVPSYNIYTCTLDTKDFYGNVYNFETYYTQEKVFDIKGIENIVEMRLYLFQEDNFLKGGVRIPSKESDTATIELPDNIFMSSPYISLGYDLNTFTEDTVLLYTLDPVTYAAALTDEKKAELIAALDQSAADFKKKKNKILYDNVTAKSYLKNLNKRLLQMRWVYLDDEDNPKAMDNVGSLPKNAIIHWYKYNLKEGIEDELAGPFWVEEKLPTDNSFEYKYFNPRMTETHELLKVIIEYPSREYIAEKIYNAKILDQYQPNKKSGTFYNCIKTVKKKLDSDIEYNRNILEDLDAQTEAVSNLCEERDREIENAKTEAEVEEISNRYAKKVDSLLEDTRKKYEKLQDLKDKIISYEAETEYYVSDTLELTNETDVPNGTSVDLISGLDIQCDVNGYNGCYRIYDINGNIMSGNESSKRRLLTATYQSLVTGDTKLDSAEKIFWYFPKNNSMIEYPKENTEYSFYDAVSLTAATYTPDGSYFIKVPDGTYEPSTSAYSSTAKYYERNNTTITETDDGQYFVICRLGVSLGAKAGESENKNDEQYFRIKSYYSQTLVNNTIICVIEKNGFNYRKECNLVFGPSGSNGTSYTLTLEFENKIPALTVPTTILNNKPTASVKVIPHLYDYQNKEITATYAAEGKISYNWYCKGNDGIGISDVNTKDGSVNLTCLSTDINDYKYHILQCSVSKVTEIVPDTGITLTAYLPIPVRSSEIYTSFEGADKIVYDSSGGNARFYKGGYKIYKYDSTSRSNKPVTSGISWKMYLGTDTVGEASGNNTSLVESYYPKVTTKGILTAPGMFLKENGKQVGVGCLINNTLVWFQPIYIYQNSYNSAMLNSWDGSLTIDEKNGTILSTMIGAGRKDSLNRFNGVLMGDISTAENTKDTGIYGYHQGVRSFGLNIDGTAFIGKSGKAQIQFDGNSGYIQSGNYGKDNAGGMKIDLDGKTISIVGERYSSARATTGGTTYNSITDAANAQKAFYNKVITNFNSSINSLESEKTYNKNKIKVYKEKISDYNNIITENNNKIKQADIDITKNDDAKKEKNNSITSKQSQIKNKQEEKKKVQADTKKTSLERINDISKLNNEIKTLKLQINDLTKEVRNIENKQTTLKTNKASYQRIIDRAKERVKSYNNKIKELNNEKEINEKIAKYNKDKAVYESLVSKIDNKVETLNNEKNSYKIKRLQNSLATFLSKNGNVVDLKYVVTNSKVILSALDPYLRIISKNDKTLINIGEEEYYLQTDDYAKEVKSTETNKGVIGKGLKIDLANNKIDAYNFTLKALNSDTSSKYFGSFLQMSSNGSPYLKVHYKDTDGKNVDLVNITNDKFSLSSQNWNSKDQSGLNFDLTAGKLTAYNNFVLKATDSTTGSYVQLNSAGTSSNPYFQVFYKKDTTDTGINLMEISKTSFVLQSHNWNTANSSGIQLDMLNGKIIAYQFVLKAYSSDKKYTLLIDSTQSKVPFKIGTNFEVSWDGSVTMNNVTATKGGQIGPFIISSSALYNSSNGGEFDSNKKGVYIGDSGLLINNTANDTDFLVRTSPTSKQYTLYVGGKTNLHGSTVISGSLSTSGSVNIEKGLTLNGKLHAGDNASIDGSLYLTGNLIVSGSISDSGGKWSHTGSGGSQQINGTSGNIGGWGIGPNSLSGGSTTLNSNGKVQIGSIIIDGSNAGNEIIKSSGTTLTLGGTLTSISNKLSCQGITCGKDATFSEDVNITGDLNVKSGTATIKDLEVTGSLTFGRSGTITLPKELNIIWQSGLNSSSRVIYDASSDINFGVKLLHITSTDGKTNKYINLCGSLTSKDGSPGKGTVTLGNLAFADDIKKKFSMTIDISRHISKSATTFYINGKNQYRVVKESGTLYKKTDSTTTHTTSTTVDNYEQMGESGYLVTSYYTNANNEKVIEYWYPTKRFYYKLQGTREVSVDYKTTDYDALQAADYAYIPKEFEVTTNTITFEGTNSVQGDTIDLGTH